MKAKKSLVPVRSGKQLRKVEHEMKKEEANTIRSHNIEHREIVQALRVKEPVKKKPRYRVKQQAPNVNFAPHGGRPVALDFEPPTIVSLTRDFREYNAQLKAGANPATPRANVDLGAFRVAKIKTKFAFTDAIFNGVATGECRYPDPFSFAKSTVYQTSNTVSDTSAATSSTSTSSTYDFCTAGVFRGSPVKAYLRPAAPVTNSFKFNWLQSAGVWYDVGLNSANFYSRPIGLTFDVIPRLVGVAHTIKMYAFPIQPVLSTDMSTSDIVGWPEYPNEGLSPAQVSWGGREFEIDSTSKGIRLCCLPWDSRGFDFALSSAERYGIANSVAVAWSGWVWWINGMTEADRVDIVVNCVEEAIYRTLGVATQYAAPQNMRPSNSVLKDKLVNTAQSLAMKGLAAYSMIDEVVDVAKKAWGIGSKIAGAMGLMAGGMFSPAPLLTNPETIDLYKKVAEEKEVDDPKRLNAKQLLVERFLERNSQSSSSSSGDGRLVDTPRAPAVFKH